MIIVKIFKETDTETVELGKIEIRNESPGEDEADYTVKFGVERGTAVGLHTRWLYGFPRTRYNVLALLLQALKTLDEKDFELERGYDLDSPDPQAGSPDLVRRLRARVREIQRGQS